MTKNEPSGGPESAVDVLIIGAGPAGLIAALWMARCGIKARVVERRPDEIRVGCADGIKPRTMEIFESFGFAQDVSQLWEPSHELAVWFRDDNGDVRRQFHMPLRPPLRTSWHDGLLQQGVIENIIKQQISKDSPNMIEHETVPTSLKINEDQVEDLNAYPFVVTLCRQPRANYIANAANIHSEEVVRARYIIGADGTRSWTRNQIQLTLEKEVRTQLLWAVIDLRIVSDFPDIGISVKIIDHREGGLFFVRRERGLNRFYLQLTDGQGKSLCRESITQDFIIDRLQHLLRPYRFTVEYCEWWSTFTIARSMSSAMAKYDRMFLVGDAAHSHSPFGGLGMNISIQDSYNLGWKLAGVIRKELNIDILKTYELERRPIAHELLEVDDLLVAFFSPETGQEAGAANEKERFGLFLSGLLVQYPATILSVPSQATKALQHGHIIPGMRLPDVTISNQSTTQRASLLSLLRSDGQFHIVIFAGDIAQLHQREQLNSFGLAIQLIANRVLPPTCSGFNVIAIHTAQQKAVELTGIHKIFLADQITMHCDNNRVYCNMDVAYEAIGVEDNTVVIVRPDQYVGWRGKIDDVDGLEIYLRGIFKHQSIQDEAVGVF